MLLKKTDKKNRFFKNLPISIKITVWYTFFIIILMLIMIFLSWFISKKLTDDISRKELLTNMNKRSFSNKEFEPFDNGIFFIKYDKYGNLIEGLSPKDFDLTLKFSEKKISIYKSNSNIYYYYDIKIKHSSEWIRGIYPASKRINDINKFFNIILISTPILLIFIIYGGYKIIKQGLKPVNQISNTALEIQKSKDFSKRIELNEGKDEIHQMADTFNQMLNSLENSYKHEKQFNSDVSHELKTPVTVILAQSEYSLKHIDDIQEAKESFLVIQRQSQKMSNLINQIMELSKIEQQKEIDLKPIDFSKLIQESLSDYKSLLEEKNIKLNHNIQDNIMINAEKTMIIRVFDNLITNAIKFTKDQINIKLYSEQNKCFLEIYDNGIGISEDKKELIWERFYQINSSRNKENNQGYGLGLSLVSKILNLHHSKIKLESEIDKGSTFIVEFELI